MFVVQEESQASDPDHTRTRKFFFKNNPLPKKLHGHICKFRLTPPDRIFCSIWSAEAHACTAGTARAHEQETDLCSPSWAPWRFFLFQRGA
jgi:hypothetical protein